MQNFQLQGNGFRMSLSAFFNLYYTEYSVDLPFKAFISGIVRKLDYQMTPIGLRVQTLREKGNHIGPSYINTDAMTALFSSGPIFSETMRPTEQETGKSAVHFLLCKNG
jgi:hypothetical protein